MHYRHFSPSLLSGFIAAFLLLSGAGWLAHRNVIGLINNADGVARTHEVLEHVDHTLSLMAEAETATRGFVIAGADRYLEPYDSALPGLKSELNILHTLLAENPRQLARLERLVPLIDAKRRFLAEVVDVRRHQTMDAAAGYIRRDRGNTLMNEIRSIIREMTAEEQQLLISRDRSTKASAQTVTLTIVAGTLFSLLLVTSACLLIRRDLSERHRFEAELEQRNGALAHQAGEQSLLCEMGELLQSCLTMSEAAEVMAKLSPQLFPGVSGALYIVNASRTVLESVASWGADTVEDGFQPTDCWALRRGQVYKIHGGSDVRCGHLTADPQFPSLCVPLTAQGETLGMLHLRIENITTSPLACVDSHRRLAITVADQLALALANLKLRETLRIQSIRDPLTGLFNRRYLEESLERELLAALRNNTSLSVIMMDLDHFKRFNDHYGHAVGDALLREVATYVKANVRGADIACRYGGEELFLILPGATLEQASHRAEALREGIKSLNVQHGGQTVGNLTMSCGVALFPADGTTSDMLIAAADGRLYHAKKSGRDLVVTGA